MARHMNQRLREDTDQGVKWSTGVFRSLTSIFSQFILWYRAKERENVARDLRDSGGRYRVKVVKFVVLAGMEIAVSGEESRQVLREIMTER